MVPVALALVLIAAEGGSPVGAARPTCLLVAPPSLESAAAAWRSYRESTGWSVAPIRTVDDDGNDLSAELLRTRVRAAASEAMALGAPRVAVLLLGDVTIAPATKLDPPATGAPGPRQALDGPAKADSAPRAAAGRCIPTFLFDQPDPRLVDRADPRFASDHPYQLVDDADEKPDIALGRVAVQSNDEALAVLEKVRRYESAPGGAWRGQLTFVASEGRFGVGDAVMEQLFRSMVDTMIPVRFAISMTFASPLSPYCPPPSSLERTVAGRFAEPALFLTYLGHGAPRSLDRMHWGAQRPPLLTIESLTAPAGALTAPRGTLPVAFLGCCSVGWFDRADGRPSLAEAMLEAPGGPIAVIAGSRPTHPYGTAALQKNLVRELLAGRVDTIGELDLRATRGMLERDGTDETIDAIVRPIAALTRWPCSLDELRLMHARMYNLLGDPCTRLALPPREPDELGLDGSSLRGRADGAVKGEVTVVIETDRPSCAHGPLVPAMRRDDPDLERIATENYPLANERALWRGTAELHDGRFGIDLPSPLPAHATIVRCFVVATDAFGRTVERLGGLRIEP